MTLITLFLVLNPAVVAVIWLRYRSGDGSNRLIEEVAPVAVLSLALLAVAVLVGEPVLDALDVSDATFRIAAGALVVFGALQAFVGYGLRHELTSRTWLIAACLVWLASPPAVVAAVAIRLNDGVGVALAAVLVSVVAAVLLGYAWKARFGGDYPVVLGLIQRVLAAGAAFGGVDLIRQGVLSI